MQYMQLPKKQSSSKNNLPNGTDAMHQSGIHNEISTRTEQVEYELEEPEFDMSDMDESIMNSSFR